MMKLVDVSKIESYIDNLIEEYKKLNNEKAYQVMAANRIDVLQTLSQYLKEISEENEVDLDNEIMQWEGESFPEGTNITPLPKAMKIVKNTANHFFKLGLSSKQEDCPNIKGYVARNKDGNLFWFQEKPQKVSDTWWCVDDKSVLLDKELYPEITWESEEPTEVELSFKKLNSDCCIIKKQNYDYRAESQSI